MLQHHLVTCALKMSLFITALQTYRHQPNNYVEEKKSLGVFHSFILTAELMINMGHIYSFLV